MNKIIIDAQTGEETEVEMTAEEISEQESQRLQDGWNVLRMMRNGLLAASDWTQTADAPVDASAWSAYRQALRDLPANTTDPFVPVWPTPPA